MVSPCFARSSGSKHITKKPHISNPRNYQDSDAEKSHLKYCMEREIDGVDIAGAWCFAGKDDYSTYALARNCWY